VICGSCSAFWCVQCAKRRHTIFSSSRGIGTDSQKARPDTLCRTYVFAFTGICGSRSAFQCVRGVKDQHTIFHVRAGPIWIQQKARRDTIHRTCVFAYGGICGSSSAFWCVWGMKHWRTLFHVRVGPVRIHKKRTGTRYAALVFLHSLGSAGHVVHSGVSGARKIDTLFFMFGLGPIWIQQKARRDTIRRTCVFASAGICGSRSAFRCVQGAKRGHTIFSSSRGIWIHKRHVETRYATLVSLHSLGSTGHAMHSGASRVRNVRLGHEMMMHIFSCSGGTDLDSTKSTTGHVTLNLCFRIRWYLRVT
jgi:hypothetical protein